jgi:hypothetical protein
VRSVGIDEDIWYRIGAKDARYFFKIGASPF